MCVCVCTRARAEREREPFQSAGTFGLVTSTPHCTEVVSKTLKRYRQCQVSSQEYREDVMWKVNLLSYYNIFCNPKHCVHDDKANNLGLKLRQLIYSGRTNLSVGQNSSVAMFVPRCSLFI